LFIRNDGIEWRRSNHRVEIMDTKHAVEQLAALAHEHRLAVYRLLVATGTPGLCAGTIAERLGIPSSSLTFHTQALVRAGLATQQRAGRQLIYTADFTAMNGLIGFLTENCCGQDAPCRPVCDPVAAS
jgi:ArsR family transcriptional regulator